MVLKGKNDIKIVKQNLDDTLKMRNFMGVDGHVYGFCIKNIVYVESNSSNFNYRFKMPIHYAAFGKFTENEDGIQCTLKEIPAGKDWLENIRYIFVELLVLLVFLMIIGYGHWLECGALVVAFHVVWMTIWTVWNAAMPEKDDYKENVIKYLERVLDEDFLRK